MIFGFDLSRPSQHALSRLAAAIVVAAVSTAAIPSAASAASSITYTALGDSLAFGAFAPIGQGYVPLYAKYVEQDTGVSVQLVNLGVPGWQSADLRYAVQNRFFFRLSLFFSQLITFNIGGNDLNAARNSYKAGTCGGPLNQDCLNAAVTSFKSNWDGILQGLFQLRRGRPTVFRTMTIYDPFVAEDLAADTFPGDGMNDFQVLKIYLDMVNDYITTQSLMRGVLVAPVYEAFNGPGGNEDPIAKGLISFDGFHPNGKGHALMAFLLRTLGYAAIVP
jgi:lysophospholipase L1-like esterase